MTASNRATIRVARLRTVVAREHPDLISVRGPKGRGQHDPAHPHITAAGFVPDEPVVLISEADFYRLRHLAGECVCEGGMCSTWCEYVIEQVEAGR